MTKHELAKTIYEIVDNQHWMRKSKKTIIESIEILLNDLEPIDKEKFAKYGYPHQISTPENCWK